MLVPLLQNNQQIKSIAGVRFVPVRVGEVKAQTARVSVKLGRAGAIGEVIEYFDDVVVVKAPVVVVEVPVVVVGMARARGAEIISKVGRAYGEGAIYVPGHVSVSPSRMGVRVGRAYGDGEIIIPASVEVNAVFAYCTAPTATGTGVANLSEEEIIMMYAKHRNSKRLQNSPKYGSIRA